MPLERKKKMGLLAGAVAVAGISAAVWAAIPYDKASLSKAAEAAMKKGDYPAAARMTKSYIDSHPKEIEPYAFWIGSLALANRIDEARAALETAKGVFPEHVATHAQPVAEAIDKIESGYRLREEGDTAAGRGLPFLAARKYAEAYELLLWDPRVGLKAARTWVSADEPVKAVLVLRKLVDKGYTDAASELKAVAETNKDALTKAAVTATSDGWKTLDGYEGDDAVAKKAKDLFQQAIDLSPAHAALAASGVETMRSPYYGLATAAAADSMSWEVREAIIKAKANGVPAPSGSLSGRAGAAFGTAFCESGTVETLEGAYGDRAKAWGTVACETFKGAEDWQKAVDIFDKANRAGTDPHEALSGFEEAKDLFARDWASRFPATTYSERATCNVAFLKAWIATFDPVDRAGLDAAVADSAACPTKDFVRKRLDEKVATIVEGAAKRETFTLRVCNRSGEDRVRIAYMRGRPDGGEELILKGWWDVEKGKCQDLPASYAGAEQADVYLAAYSQSYTWWPWEGADTSACTVPGKFERPSSPGEIACPNGEDLRGFLKLTAKKRPGKNVVTYNLKNP